MSDTNNPGHCLCFLYNKEVDSSQFHIRIVHIIILLFSFLGYLPRVIVGKSDKPDLKSNSVYHCWTRGARSYFCHRLWVRRQLEIGTLHLHSLHYILSDIISPCIDQFIVDLLRMDPSIPLEANRSV